MKLKHGKLGRLMEKANNRHIWCGSATESVVVGVGPLAFRSDDSNATSKPLNLLLA